MLDRMALKESLRRVIAETRAKEESDLVPHVDDATSAPLGQWTARDNLAHLSAWRRHAAADLIAARTGGQMSDAGEGFEALNARIYEQTHGLSAAAVLEDSRRSWEELEAALEACSEEDLHKPRPGGQASEAWQAVPGNTHLHLGEHLGYWSSDRGDEAAAEAAARWAYDLDLAVFTDAKARAGASYNLGCYYSRRGQAELALSLFETAFDLDPSLREWAGQDPDLDPIRGDPRLSALLN